MNIGIDIDGVLVDIGKFMHDKGTRFFQKKYNMKLKNPDAYSMTEMFGCTLEQEKKFWKQYGIQYCALEPCMKDCAQIIRKLHDEGHRIYLITSRAFTAGSGMMSSLARMMLRSWLHRHRIVYDEIVYCTEEESAFQKLSACKEHDIGLMIDDKPSNLLALKGTVDALCYDSPWNRHLRDTVIRVHNWREVYAMITKVLESREYFSLS